MIDVVPFESLGRFDNDWLNARYHFSFSGYHDPKLTGVGALLVWNDDVIARRAAASASTRIATWKSSPMSGAAR